MKISVIKDGRHMDLLIPMGLLCNGFVLRLLLKSMDRAAVLPPLSGDAVRKIMMELRRIQKKYGSWDLIDVQSADGERVHIRL